jgi:hypothetical protein
MRSHRKCKFYKPRSKKVEACTSAKDDAERAEREAEFQLKKAEVCASLLKKLTLVARSANQKILTSIVRKLLWPLFLEAEISIKCLADGTSLCPDGPADLLIIGNFATHEYFMRIMDGDDGPRCAAQIVSESGSTFIGDHIPQQVLYGILKVGYFRACFIRCIHILPSMLNSAAH